MQTWSARTTKSRPSGVVGLFDFAFEAWLAPFDGRLRAASSDIITCAFKRVLHVVSCPAASPTRAGRSVWYLLKHFLVLGRQICSKIWKRRHFYYFLNSHTPTKSQRQKSKEQNTVPTDTHYAKKIHVAGYTS